MWLMFLFSIQLFAQNIPDYRDDLDRLNNMTWSGRAKWAEVTPNIVTVYYADIPEHLKATVENTSVASDFYLPEFAKVSNRFFWVDDTNILYRNESVAREYKSRTKALKNFLSKFDIPIQSELRGIPLTSHATLKVFHPDEPKSYAFLKLFGSHKSTSTTDLIKSFSNSGLRLAFYPEVMVKGFSVSNLKRGRKAKKIPMPSQVFRSSEVVSTNDFTNEHAISLHSFLSDKTLLQKLKKASNHQTTLDWYNEAFVNKLALFFYESYTITGILPAAHAQNIVAIIDKNYKLNEFVWRDLVDLSHNPVITYLNFGFALISDSYNQINKLSSEVIHNMWLPLVGPFLPKNVPTGSFANYFGEHMGQLFNIKLESDMGFYDRHELVVKFFKRVLGYTYSDNIVESVTSKMRAEMTSYSNVIEFSKYAAEIYHDFHTQSITNGFPVNKYTTNYSKQSLVKAFIKALKDNNVGFYDQYPKRWLRLAKKDKHHLIADELFNSARYRFVSNGANILLLQDIEVGKWIALSYRNHTPVPYDYLKHQKLLKMKIDYTYFRQGNFSCKVLFY